MFEENDIPDVLEPLGLVDKVVTPEEIVVTIVVGTRSFIIDASILSAKPA